MKILFVEDTFRDIQLYAHTFMDFGHEVIVAGNPGEAAELLEKEQDFDTIILDSFMPDKKGGRAFSHSGPSIFNDLRSGRWGDWGKIVPIFFCTAYGRDVRERLREMPGPAPVEILGKPMDLASVVKAVDPNNLTLIINSRIGGDLVVGDQKKTINNECARQAYDFLHDPNNIELIKKLSSLWNQSEGSQGLDASTKILDLRTTKDEQRFLEKFQSTCEWISQLSETTKKVLSAAQSLGPAISPLLIALGLG